MSKRSIVLGLLGGAVVCGLCFFNDRILQQTYLVGNNMPASVYGVLILFVVLVNPLLRRGALNGREIAIILALTLAACSIPGGGLLRQLVPTVVMPHHFRMTEPGWKEQRVVERVPARMLVDASQDEDRVVTGFVQGMGQGGRHIRLGDVPWGAWSRTLAFWLPIVLTLWIGLIGLSVALHRQWSQHEHLPYPVARFTSALLPGEGGARCALFRERGFWVTTLIVLSLHFNNLAATWFPDVFIRIATRLDFSALGALSETFVRGGGGGLLRPHIYLIVIGIAFFIPSDVSLSFGIGPFVFAFIAGVFAKYGLVLTAPLEGYSYFSLKPQSFLLFGANVGVIAAMIFTGRHYYASVLRRSLGAKADDSVDAGAVWGCRTFLIMTVLFVLQLRLAGIDLVLAALYATFMVIGFVVLSRVMAETGLIYVKCYFWPCTVLWGMLGARAVGPDVMLLMMLTTTILFIDPREALTPFMTNSLKVLEEQKERIGRTAAVCAVAVVLGLTVSLPVTLYFKYDMGAATGDSWATNHVPKNPFANVVMMERKLQSQGAGEALDTGGFLSRLGEVRPNAACMWSMAAGLALVLLFTAARLRFTWWPLHPLVFVVWASTPLRCMGVSYFIGWLVKALVSKYGGSHAYNRLKPVMMGLIAGEVLGALFPSLIGAIYYLITNQRPMVFNVLPG